MFHHVLAMVIVPQTGVVGSTKIGGPVEPLLQVKPPSPKTAEATCRAMSSVPVQRTGGILVYVYI